MSSGKLIAATVGALAVAGVVVALVARGGSGSKQSPTAATPTQSTTMAKAHPPKAKPKQSHREGVRRGHGTTPDEPAPGTGALLAIADNKSQTFTDPRFRSLGVARSRLNTPWNSIFTERPRL